METIPYGRQWIDKKDIAEVVKVLKSDWLTQGSKVEEFEKAVAKYCQAKYAVAFSSGTAALHAAYFAIGLKKEDEIITSPLTFAATANTAVFFGAKPVFADIDIETLNINPEEIEKKITKKTKAITAVDFAGHPCDYDKIFKIAKKHNLLVIEDAAHSLGSEYKGKKIGSLADLTVFSFHPVKNITTGEGGMVLTDRKDFYDKMKAFRHHGINKKPELGGWYYEIETPGQNYRLTDIQSALGLSQLKKIGKFIAKRREIAKQYSRELKNIKEIILPQEKDFVKTAWHIYPIQLKLEKLKAGRRTIFDKLRKQGIGVQVHYMPLHLHPFYKNNYGYKKGDFPIAEKYYERAVTLPLFPKMTSQEIRKVISAVKKIISRARI